MAAEPNTEPTRPLPEEGQEEFDEGEESDEYEVDEEDSYEPNEGENEGEEYDDEEVVEVGQQHPSLTALLLGNGVPLQEDEDDEDDDEDEEEEYYGEVVGTAENPIDLLPDNDLKPVNAGTKRSAEFDDDEDEEDEASAPKKAKV
ncbi:hypothetical protein EV401DRAFT_1883320 [Pisolithus croceorrhizus]|nr:hypothetical protein EV401DRAFT_1883320 [Pisolithus croceorrhizus]